MDSSSDLGRGILFIYLRGREGYLLIMEEIRDFWKEKRTDDEFIECVYIYLPG